MQKQKAKRIALDEVKAKNDNLLATNFDKFISKWLFKHIAFTIAYIILVVGLNEAGLLNDTFSFRHFGDFSPFVINYHITIVNLLLLIIQKRQIQAYMKRTFKYWYTTGVVAFVALTAYAFMIISFFDFIDSQQIYYNMPVLVVGLSLILLICLYIPQGLILIRNTYGSFVTIYVIISTFFMTFMIALPIFAGYFLILFWWFQGLNMKFILRHPLSYMTASEEHHAKTKN